MKLILFIFFLTQTQEHVFNQSLHKQTNTDENRSQKTSKESGKSSIAPTISNKIFVIIIACLITVVIVV